MGIATLRAHALKEYPDTWRQHLIAHHAVTKQFLNCRSNRGAEHAMGSFPRYNYRAGPNGGTKAARLIEDNRGRPRRYLMSPDTELVEYDNISNWILQKLMTPACREATTTTGIGEGGQTELFAQYIAAQKKKIEGNRFANLDLTTGRIWIW